MSGRRSVSRRTWASSRAASSGSGLSSTQNSTDVGSGSVRDDELLHDRHLVEVRAEGSDLVALEFGERSTAHMNVAPGGLHRELVNGDEGARVVGSDPPRGHPPVPARV